ncbi:nucleobase:cation symporter-2 family protein [Pelosinus fermentans]|uniref:Xanthine permease n=1 Tax=Pelosinus fermentans JBW45 TaxID=1192197 RepID=I8U268_9FIRM|nr:nucleobase:cation symporter-2 family protein [Pelosinus fermentans]AJQ27879.1 xanthine permease [Pelosinus fermentans JBW45]
MYFAISSVGEINNGVIEMPENVCHPVDEKLPLGQTFVYGLQHVLAMYAGAVAVPLILANALKLPNDVLIYLINADLFVAGITTIIQCIGFGHIGSKLPLMQGVTFAAVTPMIIIGQTHGLTSIFGSTIAAGVITYLLSPYFSKLLRFFPQVVTGTIITIIGISLLPVAVNWSAGGNPSAPNYANGTYICLAFVVLSFILLLNRYCKGFLSNISVLLGLIFGTIIAIPLGITDLSKISQANWIGVTSPFAFGLPTFEFSSILAMTVVMLVVMTETTGDLVAIAEIVKKPLQPNDLTKGLRTDGIGTLIGGIFNSFPHTAFAQNVGLVSLTGIKSRFVVASGGFILIVLGLLPKAAALVAAIPNPVLGGAGIVMFGMVAASGIKSLAKVNYEGNKNSLIVAVSVGVSMIPLAVPSFYHTLPEWAGIVLHSGITGGTLAAILLNAFFNEFGRIIKKQESSVA